MKARKARRTLTRNGGVSRVLCLMMSAIFVMAFVSTYVTVGHIPLNAQDWADTRRSMMGKIKPRAKAAWSTVKNATHEFAAIMRSNQESSYLIDDALPIMLPQQKAHPAPVAPQTPPPVGGKVVKEGGAVDTVRAVAGGSGDGSSQDAPLSSSSISTEDEATGEDQGELKDEEDQQEIAKDADTVQASSSGDMNIAECSVSPAVAPCSDFMSPLAHAAAYRAKEGQAGAKYGAEAFKADIASVVQDKCSIIWSVNRTDPRSLLFATRGQMSNVFIQYFYMRIVADSHGLRLHENKHTGRLKKVNMVYNKSEARSTRSLRHFRYVTLFEEGPKVEVLPNAKCGQFYQKYDYFRSERCFSQCLFAPGPDSISDAVSGMGCNDVAIHIRAPWFRDGKARNYTVPPDSYYDVILSRLQREKRLGRIWLLSDGRLCKTGVSKYLREKYGALCHGGTVAQDHFLARSAPVFIGSFGTFTWTAAYLASSREIHLPFDSSHVSGSSWAHWDGLFMDDDDRILYHDMHGEGRQGTTYLSARQVLEGGSAYVKGIKASKVESEGCLPRQVTVVPRQALPPPYMVVARK